MIIRPKLQRNCAITCLYRILLHRYVVFAVLIIISLGTSYQLVIQMDAENAVFLHEDAFVKRTAYAPPPLSNLQNKESIEIRNTDENLDDESTVSSSSLHLQNETVKELHLYLHIGPGKMATTTIQDSLMVDEKPLNEDGYCVYDPKVMRNHIGPMIQKGKIDVVQRDKKWNELRSFLDRCHSLNQNALLSSEFLGLVEPRMWNEVMKPVFSQWKLHIVVGYRRYYEWVPSVHFQIHRANLRQFSNGKSKDRRIPSIHEFVSKDERPLILYTENYLRHWKSLVGDDFAFLIYNLDESQNVMKTVYCKMLHDTKNACRKYMKDPFGIQNVGHTLEYDRLVMEAYDNKLIGDRRNLHKAAAKLKTIHEQEMTITKMEFPKICMDDRELANLLNITIRMEETLVPDWFSSENGEAAIQQGFMTFEKAKLCGVDVTKVVKGEQYANMWMTLRESLK